MANLKLKNPSGGSLNLVSADGASDLTLTLPATTGTVALTSQLPVAGTGPAFFARMSTNQSVTGSTTTKVIFNSEVFDTNNNYDPSTNYRFTPTVAGYYQVNAFICWGGFASTQGNIFLYKNGSTYSSTFTPGSGYGYNNMIAVIMYMNGSTDYVEVYCGNSSNETLFGSTQSGFSAVLVRSA